MLRAMVSAITAVPHHPLDVRPAGNPEVPQGPVIELHQRSDGLPDLTFPTPVRRQVHQSPEGRAERPQPIPAALQSRIARRGAIEPDDIPIIVIPIVVGSIVAALLRGLATRRGRPAISRGLQHRLNRRGCGRMQGRTVEGKALHQGGEDRPPECGDGLILPGRRPSGCEAMSGARCLAATHRDGPCRDRQTVRPSSPCRVPCDPARQHGSHCENASPS